MNDIGALGKVYNDGEVIIKEGDVADCMYVIQEGQVEIVTNKGGQEVRLGVRGKGEFIGEMAIFLKQERTANVRVIDSARILTIDKKNFIKRIHEDPTIAFKLVETLSQRVHELSIKLAENED